MADLGAVCSSNSFGPANNLLSTFLLTMATIHCNMTSSVQWPRDYGETALNYGLDDYDFVVIGAGSAGSVVAGRLAENIHNRILLIEAGDDPPLESEIPGLGGLLGSSVDYLYKTEPDSKACRGAKSGHCLWSKGKMIGGSHSINAMIHIRGNSLDYDEWVMAGNPSWGWSNVQYYFKKTEKFLGKNRYHSHGVRGPMNVEPFPIPQIDQMILQKAASELGYEYVEDFTDGPSLGFGKIYGTIQKGRRMSTAKAFLTKRQPNLHVIKNAVAYKIDFSRNLRAKSVRFAYKKTHKMKVNARKEIIVSAGSIETPKLLMLSGVGARSHLESLGIPVIKDLPVGYNLQDHVRVEQYIRMQYRKDVDLTRQFLDSVYNQWVHGTGPYSSALMDYTGFVSTDGNPRFPDIQYMFVAMDNVSLAVSGYHDRIGESIVDGTDRDDRVIMANAILAKPKSRGYLKLRSADYRDDPLIYHNYFDDRDDMRRLVKGIQKLVNFENTTTFRELDAQFVRVNIPECDRHEYRGSRYWECYIRYMTGTTFHAVGTTKMGPKSDKMAVVNSELEVYGVKGLRVIDAGVMPTVPSVNTNPASIMIGEKGADFIKRKWKLWYDIRK